MGFSRVHYSEGVNEFTGLLEGMGSCFRKVKDIEEQWSHKIVSWMETYRH
jgi:hypothetical protein